MIFSVFGFEIIDDSSDLWIPFGVRGKFSNTEAKTCIDFKESKKIKVADASRSKQKSTFECLEYNEQTHIGRRLGWNLTRILSFWRYL